MYIYYGKLKCSFADIEIMLPLLQTVAQWLDIHASENIIIEQFSFLKENEEFMKVYNMAVDYGLETALQSLIT